MTKNGKEAASFLEPTQSWRVEATGAATQGRSFWTLVAMFSLAAILFQLTAHFAGYVDYLGPDPDDSMRLVEVRDFLNGQSWFDLRQYRLGPDGGTLMHWSRLIDLPIAALIAFFRLFLSPHMAEATAAAVWPPLLLVPLMVTAGAAGFRIGGLRAAPMAMGLALLFTCAITRFRPGGLDHHNVQLVLAMTIAAMLIDPLARFSNFAIAAIACSLGLAIGVETTPLVAVSAITVSLLWAWYGVRYQRAAIGFGLALAIATGVLFFITTPPRLYLTVECDTLSLGFFSLAAAGGFGLAAAATLLTRRGFAMRMAGLVLIGMGVLALAVLAAPQCLSNPLDQLDPILKTMWLVNITEAQSIVAESNIDPTGLGGFYAVGLIAVAVCLFRIRVGQQPLPYTILLVLIATSWAVSAYQVRGMVFANMLAFIPLSALVADLRMIYLSRQKDVRAIAAFALSALASIPTVWAFSGAMITKASSALADTPAKNNTGAEPICNGSNLTPLAALPTGRILATSSPGAWLLRYTPHSVLTANYHRNQRGMLDALKVGMASPADAIGILRADKVTYVLLCGGDPQLKDIIERAPIGLFGRLENGEIPEYLEPIEIGSEKHMKLFKVL